MKGAWVDCVTHRAVAEAQSCVESALVGSLGYLGDAPCLAGGHTSGLAPVFATSRNGKVREIESSAAFTSRQSEVFDSSRPQQRCST